MWKLHCMIFTLIMFYIKNLYCVFLLHLLITYVNMLKVFSMQSWNNNRISLLQFVIKMGWSNRKKNVGGQCNIGCALRDNNQVRVKISLPNRSHTLYSLFHFKCTFPSSSFLDFTLYISEDTDSTAVLNCIGFLEGEERGGHKQIRLLVLTQPWAHRTNQRTISYSLSHSWSCTDSSPPLERARHWSIQPARLLT